MNKTDQRFVLASGSPQRRRLLAEAGYQFDIVVPDVIEPEPELFADGESYVAHTAWLKARAVATRMPHAQVLAADTTVAVAGHIIGKASDRNHARQILQSLSGTEHEVLTGVCLWLGSTRLYVTAVDRTRLCMRPLTDDELDAYLATDRWVDKAGAYGIQDPDPYVSVIEGSYSNVVGLPLELVDRIFTALEQID